MTLSGSYLLRHTLNNNPSDSYFSYTKPYDGPPLPKSKLLSDPRFAKYNFVDASRSTVYINNPILTDVTQAEHTDIYKILQQNPDVNGLSLILEDAASQHNSEMVSFEDFVPPSRYTDIFDVQDFYKQAQKSFQLLPAALRKMYDNDPASLVDAISKKDPRAVSAIESFLGLDVNQYSVSQADVNQSSEAKKSSSVKSAPLDASIPADFGD